MFTTLHTLFETQYTELALAVDEIAERIRALGHPAPGSYTEFMRLAAVKEAEGVPSATGMIEQLAADQETVADSARAVVHAAGRAGDDASGDLGAAGLSADGPGSVAPPADLPRAVTMIRLPAARALLVGPTADLATVGSTLPRSPAGAWETLAVKLGEPEVYPATSESWIPQMLNLDLLGAVSFRKGCYPGQEIVARTQHLGRIKRRLFRYHVTGPAVPAPGTALLSGQARVGEVVRVAGVEGRAELLAVVALESRGLGLVAEDGGATCTPEPLPYAVPEAAAAT